MKAKSTYTISIFTRILLGLLAVFYVTVFAIEATHSHDNLVEKAGSSETSDTEQGTDNCYICAYFGHHEIKGIGVVTDPSFVLIDFQDCPFRSFETNQSSQTYFQYFLHRGPPLV